eukprot:UN01845
MLVGIIVLLIVLLAIAGSYYFRRERPELFIKPKMIFPEWYQRLEDKTKRASMIYLKMN